MLRTQRAAVKSTYNVRHHSYKIIMKTPVDMDPKVAALHTAKHSALAGLNVAKAAVGVTGATLQGAGKVSSWAAKNSGKILMLDAASFSSRLDSYLRGNRVSLVLKMRVLGKPKTLRLAVNANEIAKGQVFKNLWSSIKRGLEKKA